MSVSTSENEVTVRRLNETLAGLWAAVKSEVSSNGKGFVFVTTSNTYAEVKAIFDAGKIPLLRYNDLLAPLMSVENSSSSTPDFIFIGVDMTSYQNPSETPKLERIACTSSQYTWQLYSSIYLENTVNKVTSWSNTPSDTKYPSEKLVKTGLNGKADKVSNATEGNFAGLDANGNFTDSGKKASDFKTKQTAVADPSASGTSITFIAGVTQNENGEIVPSKKTVRGASTSQTGVVQLAGSIGASVASENNKAASEKAVRDAINAAISSVYRVGGTKTVAELTSSLLVAANKGFVYNITDSGTTTSDFIEGAGKPIRAGDNVGICAVTSGGTTTYKFDLLSGFVDLSNYVQKSSTAGLLKNDGSVDTNSYLTTTGNASDTTAEFTAASSRSNIARGEKLSVLFGKIAKWFSDLKALAFKDKVADGDISGTISDSHIASANTWNGKAAGNHTHNVTVNGVAKTIPATGENAVELMTEMTSAEVQEIIATFV